MTPAPDNDLDLASAGIEDPCLVFFSGPDCGVCTALWPKVQGLMHEAFPRMGCHRLSVVDHPAQAAQLRVFSLPTLVVFFDRRESFRFAGHLGLGQLREAIRRPYALYFD